MTGGRAYLYDPDGRHVAALDARSVNAVRLADAARDREDGPSRVAEFRGLVADQREAGSVLAARLLAERHELESDVWLVEPATPTAVPDQASAVGMPAEPAARPHAEAASPAR
jgi:glutamate synthase domain-containing protein 3